MNRPSGRRVRPRPRPTDRRHEALLSQPRVTVSSSIRLAPSRRTSGQSSRRRRRRSSGSWARPTVSPGAQPPPICGPSSACISSNETPWPSSTSAPSKHRNCRQLCSAEAPILTVAFPRIRQVKVCKHTSARSPPGRDTSGGRHRGLLPSARHLLLNRHGLAPKAMPTAPGNDSRNAQESSNSALPPYTMSDEG
jgi:hypothetical protein